MLWLPPIPSWTVHKPKIPSCYFISLSLDTTACSSLQSTNDTQSATNPTSFSNFCQAAATVTPAKSSELPTRAADVTIDHAAQPELLSDTIPNDCSAFQLPSFPPAESKSFCWGERDGASVAHSIQQCYDEVVLALLAGFMFLPPTEGEGLGCRMRKLTEVYKSGALLLTLRYPRRSTLSQLKITTQDHNG